MAQKHSIDTGFPANLSGPCVQCDQQVEVGDLIRFHKGFVSHQVCRTTETISLPEDDRGFL